MMIIVPPGGYLGALKAIVPQFVPEKTVILKETGTCWSKVAAIAALAIGVQEYYYSGIYKLIRKLTDGSGKEYECSRYKKQDFAWIFDDSGLYAAAVHKSGYVLSIIIYDCMEKKAYEYYNQISEIEVDYFYWFNGDLVLFYIDPFTCVQQIVMKLNHKKRRAEKLQIRNSPYPKYTTTRGNIGVLLYKNPRKKPIVQVIDTAVVDKQEYILLYNSCAMFVMIPKDSNSTIPIRQAVYMYPINTEILVSGAWFQVLEPICYQQFIYLPKMSYMHMRGNGPIRVEKYILDGFIEVNLENLENIEGKVVNVRHLWRERDRSGVEVLFDHVGTVPKDIKQLWTVLTVKRFGNGQVLAVVETQNQRRRYSCQIDVRKKRITWRKWQPKIQWKSNMILSSLHPSGYFIEIDYKKKQEDDKYKLFSRIVAHPNEPIELKYMSFVKLFNTEGPISSQLNSYIRKFL